MKSSLNGDCRTLMKQVKVFVQVTKWSRGAEKL